MDGSEKRREKKRNKKKRKKRKRKRKREKLLREYELHLAEQRSKRRSNGVRNHALPSFDERRTTTQAKHTQQKSERERREWLDKLQFEVHQQECGERYHYEDFERRHKHSAEREINENEMSDEMWARRYNTKMRKRMLAKDVARRDTIFRLLKREQVDDKLKSKRRSKSKQRTNNGNVENDNRNPDPSRPTLTFRRPFRVKGQYDSYAAMEKVWKEFEKRVEEKDIEVIRLKDIPFPSIEDDTNTTFGGVSIRFHTKDSDSTSLVEGVNARTLFRQMYLRFHPGKV